MIDINNVYFIYDDDDVVMIRKGQSHVRISEEDIR